MNKQLLIYFLLIIAFISPMPAGKNTAYSANCTSATANFFGITETLTTCADGSGSLHRSNIWGTYSCLVVWNSSGEEIYKGCNMK